MRNDRRLLVNAEIYGQLLKKIEQNFEKRSKKIANYLMFIPKHIFASGQRLLYEYSPHLVSRSIFAKYSYNHFDNDLPYLTQLITVD